MTIKYIACPSCNKGATIYNAKIECIHCGYGVNPKPPADNPFHGTTVVVNNTISAPRRAPTNSLGTLSLIFSLLGLLTCGILCPIGFVLGLFGLNTEPRGPAIAGTIFGALGSGMMLYIWLTMLTAMGAG